MKRLICLLFVFAFIFPSFAVSETEDDDLEIEMLLETVAPESTPSLFESDGSTYITITCTGDFTIGGDNYHHKNIFKPELNSSTNNGDINFTMKNVRHIFLEDDLTLINFEGTFTDTTFVPDNKKGNSFLFNISPSYVTVLTDNGIEAVSLENNHVMDHGEEGYEDTKRTLNEAGVVYSNSEEMGVFEVRGIQIAMLSYLCIDRYNKPVGGYDTLFDKVAADISAAKALYPIVIVSFHWGNEKDYAPTQNQIKMGRLAVDSGADLVVGHHSHRINPIEYYKGVYICYSLGNFCFAGHKNPDDKTSFIFQTRFRVSKDGEIANKGFRIIPIRISSVKNRNDFTPTVLDTNSPAVDSLFITLKANGKKLEYAVQEYPTEWD